MGQHESSPTSCEASSSAPSWYDEIMTSWNPKKKEKKIHVLGVSLNGGTPKTPRNDHFE